MNLPAGHYDLTLSLSASLPGSVPLGGPYISEGPFIQDSLSDISDATMARTHCDDSQYPLEPAGPGGPGTPVTPGAPRGPRRPSRP